MGVRTCISTNTTPTTASAAASEAPCATAATRIPMATAKRAGSTPRRINTAHQAVASPKSALGSTATNFHSCRARRRSSMRSIHGCRLGSGLRPRLSPSSTYLRQSQRYQAQGPLLVRKGGCTADSDLNPLTDLGSPARRPEARSSIHRHLSEGRLFEPNSMFRWCYLLCAEDGRRQRIRTENRPGHRRRAARQWGTYHQ